MNIRSILFVFLVVGCTGKNNPGSPLDTLTDQQKEAIVVENARLRLQIESLEHQIDSLRFGVPAQREREPSQSLSVSEPFAFILMEIEENGQSLQFGKRIQYYSVSDVLEVGELDNERKYRLLDDFQSKYMNSSEGKVYQGSVKSRKIFTFSSYEEASKAREKYIISE